MWYLQAFHPDMGMGTVMAISSTSPLPIESKAVVLTFVCSPVASGVSTSLLLETILLRYGRDGLAWLAAVRTAAGMSLISMLAMEAAENVVDFHLTGGVVQVDSPQFWAAALVSIAAGFLTPLPYNYLRLRKYGKACH